MTMQTALESFFPFAAQSEDVTVRVAVSFAPEHSRPELRRWFWFYHIRIENHGAVAIQIRTRHWSISDADGGLYEISGEGVVGETPVIASGKSYDYVSGCPLETSTGAMEGRYIAITADGRRLSIAIPKFQLESP